MSVLQVVEAREPSTTDTVVARLDEMLADLAELADLPELADPGEVSDAVRIERISRLERLRSATAAAQAAECVRFAQSQVAEQLTADVHPRAIGRGIADQIALACRISPVTGSRRLTCARAWLFDLPGTFAALGTGRVSERVAELVVTETRHLDARTRREVDAAITATGVTGLGSRAAAAGIRRLAYLADRRAYVERGRTERRHRRVGLRPAPDTMAVLTGYLPVEQGVACLAALRQHGDTAVAGGDPRTRDQIMADTLVERLTGQTEATGVSVELQLLMPLDALTEPGAARAATISGYGSLPPEFALELLANRHGRRWWRRLFTGPAGQVVGGDPTRRRFDGWLARLIVARDQACRDPFCGAPVRHLDHIVRHADGGPTTLANGRGTCARGNLVREMPGWQVILMDSGTTTHPHTTMTTTPTGHRYLSRAPDPP